MQMQIKRGSSVQYSVEIDEQTVFSQTLMGEEKIVLSFVSPQSLALQVGDYILHNSKQYKIVGETYKQQIGASLYRYEAEFFGEIYLLYDSLVKHLGRTQFSYFGTPAEMLSLLVSSLGSGWYVGGAVSLEPVSFEFKDISVRVALSEIAEKFQLEYFVDNRNIYLVQQAGSTKSLSLGYGKGQGAYDITRQSTNSNFATVWYCYGGNKNLPAGYREGLDRLSLNAPLEYNTSLYGRKEGVIEIDYIYPKRTSTITSVVSELIVVDSTLDFDLNAQEITDSQAKIVFQSGELNGGEYFITKYDSATKQITFGKNKDENGYEMPNSTFQVNVGDRYTFVGITMPNSYIVAAEAELAETCADYAEKNSQPQFRVAVNVDEKYIREGNYEYEIQAGDAITIDAPSLNFEGLIRVQSISYPLVNPCKISLGLSNVIMYSVGEQTVKEVKASQKNIVKLTRGYNAVKARMGWKTTQELLNLVFDTDGFFDMGKIRPLSVETSMLVVGVKSQQFILQVVIEPNYLGNANVVKVNSGVLVHYLIEETIKTWQIAGQTVTIPDNAARYIYAKCNRADYDDAELLFSTEQYKVDDSPTYYYFLVGVLHSVLEGVRWISLTYGATAINGRFIKTGRIQNFAGDTYFDLDLGEIAGKIKFVNSNDEYEDLADLADKSVQHFVSTTLPVPPYKLKDIWSNGSFLYRCVQARVLDEEPETTDWEDATEYDNTQTVIDGGLVTSGTIQVAGDDTNIKAGMTGVGVDDTSVRYWAGDTFLNRAIAKWRVLQSGVMYAADAIISGTIFADAGRFGVLSILGNSLINNFTSLAQIVLRNDPEGQFSAFGTNVKSGTLPHRANMILEQTGTNELGENICLELSASGSIIGNRALDVKAGYARIKEALLNGRKSIEATLNNQNLAVDVSKYDMICIESIGADDSGVNFTGTVYAGKEVAVINLNMGKAMFIYSTIRGYSSVEIPQGGAVTCKYTGTYWYVCGQNF